LRNQDKPMHESTKNVLRELLSVNQEFLEVMGSSIVKLAQ